MSITGSLTDLSLPEIFQLIEKGQKTGLLIISALPQDRTLSNDIHYIWVYQGRIVAATNRLDHQGLVRLITQTQGVSKRVITKLVEVCPEDKPLGLYFKHHSVLSNQQLKRVFQVQVLKRVRTLLELKDGVFKFIQNAPIPTREMTGLNMRTTEATLLGLRMVRNWNGLADKLPDPNGGLAPTIVGSPPYPLNNREWRVWDYARGTVSLKKIAKELRLPIEIIQKTALALITIGLVEEVPLRSGIIPKEGIASLPAKFTEDFHKQTLSPSFLETLLHLLRSKTSRYFQIGSSYNSPPPTDNEVKSAMAIPNQIKTEYLVNPKAW